MGRRCRSFERTEEQPDLIVAEAARRVDHAGWRVTAVPRMIVSETREGMSASLRQLLCEVARRQAADHLLLLTWWGIVRTTGSDVADEYYVDDKRVLVDAAGYLVDCVTDRVLWRDIARGGERGEEQTLESVRRAVLSLLHSLLPGPV